MTMRRHGWRSEDFGSPSKDGVRRRLFQSPQKPRFFHASVSSVKSGFLSKKAALIILSSVAGILLLGVHVYLFQVLLESHAVEQPQINTFRSDPQMRGNDGGRSPASVQAVPTKYIQSTPKKELTSLRPIDRDQYTIRINTWRRPEQLVISVDHHASCPGVAQIQVVWCDKENEPPPELSNYTNVVIERHDENSLNERFNILTPTPTLGILSIDDDVLRPCEAIDAGFFKWVNSPNRMVGFDARIHVENEDGSWQVRSHAGRL